MWMRTSHRLLRQEVRRSELRIMVLAIALAVLAVYSLAGFSARVQDTLVSRSSGFLAADRVLRSAHPVDEAIYQPLLASLPADNGIELAQMLEFQTMAYAGETFLLSSVKAVSGPYPLRGKLVLKSAGGQSDWQGSPEPGEAWLDRRALTALGVSLGEEVEVGLSRFTVMAEVIAEPDASFNVFRAGPRIFLNQADMAATGVIQPGSRLTYKVLFAGPESSLDALGKALESRLSENQEWFGIEDGESPLARALDRARKFLLLASLLGVILAATAISVAARRYTERHFDPVAVFKTLGMPQREIASLYAYQLLLITLAGIAIGLVGGYALQEVALRLVASELGEALPGVDYKPLLLACLTGLICAGLFSLTPMLRLARVTSMRVIRRETDYAGELQWLSVLLTGLSLFLLIWLFSGELGLSVALFGAIAVCGVAMLVLSRLMLAGARRWGKRRGSLALGVAGLYRRANSNSIQILSFSVGIMLLLTIVVLRHEMIAEWQQQLPEGTPNHFLVNIAPHEVQPVTEWLQSRQVPRSDLYPMVRGRLTDINGERLTERASKDEDSRSDRGRDGVDRELNLTWRDTAPEGNELLAGRWWRDRQENGVSVESGLASRLGIQLGDQLSFLIGGERFDAPVTSIRAVDWASMRPNFYMIFSPGALSDFPASYIGSFYLAPEQRSWIPELLGTYPTITVLDIEALIGQIQKVIDQVALALQYIMLLVVAASLLVLFAQTRASFEERRREMVILRTLGASARFIRQSIQWEFVALGLLAGVLAGWMAELSLYLIQTHVMSMVWKPHPLLWVIAAVAGALGVGLAGRIACGSLLKTTALQQVRQLEG